MVRCVSHMLDGLLADAERLAGEIALSEAPGDEVRTARMRCGFTQTELAPDLDVRRETLSRIEQGHATPTLPVVARFARVITLARHVREEAARLEKRQRIPNPRAFIHRGQGLGLDHETTEAVAQRALTAYDAKRRQLLESIGDTEAPS